MEIPVVTNLKNLFAGSKVIYAPEGSTVCGTVIEAMHVHGEWSRGQICGPADMGWKGDPTECIILVEDCEPGDSAPANAKSRLVEGNADINDGAEEEAAEESE